MQRDHVDFDDVYGEHSTTPADGATSGGASAGAPDPVAVAQAEAEVNAAAAAARAAARAVEAAEDALADAEGAVAVLEFKVEEVERDETKAPWQQAAAREELAKARRAYARAGVALEDAYTDSQAADQAHAAAQRRLEEVLATAAVEPEPTPARFASLPLFVEQFVLPNYVHHLGDNYAGRWCRSWWEHAEALTRLEAIWEAFEVMRLQPAPSFSTWLRDHFDPHMRVLTDRDGVFHRCDVEKHVHEVKDQWKTVPPPAVMFAVMKNATVQPASAGEDLVEELVEPAPAGVVEEESAHVGA